MSSLVLYVWPGRWNLPSIDPQCLAAVLHLQLTFRISPQSKEMIYSSEIYHVCKQQFTLGGIQVRGPSGTGKLASVCKPLLGELIPYPEALEYLKVSSTYTCCENLYNQPCGSLSTWQTSIKRRASRHRHCTCKLADQTSVITTSSASCSSVLYSISHLHQLQLNDFSIN